MAKWLEQASEKHEVCCHDLEVMSLNPGLAKLGVRSTSALSRTWTKKITSYWNMWRDTIFIFIYQSASHLLQ